MSFMETVFAPHAERAAKLAESCSPFANGIAWIEGEFVPLAEARIPLLDQGFLHSDLTYDVPAVWNGRFFRLDDHIDRLEASCEKLRLRLPMPRAEMRATLVDMVARSGIRDAYVEMIVTRGLKFVRGNKPEDIVNSLYMLVMPYVWVMPPDLQRSGGSAVITRTVRRVPPGAIDPTVKNLQWGDFVRGLFEAQDRNAIYPILPDGDGNITEGSGFNVVLIKDRVLYTPEHGVLEGVTRKTVFDIARKKGIEIQLEHVPVDLAYHCDELFFCTTAGGIMPVTRLDDQPVGGGQVGPITRMIWEEYWLLHDDPSYSFAVTYPDN